MNPIHRAGEAVPTTFKVPSVTLTPEAIMAMTMDERRSYYDALRLAEMALGGIISQPRYYKENKMSLNKAGDAVDALHTFAVVAIDLLIQVMRSEKPADPKDMEIKAWIDLRYEADCAESLPDFVVVAAQAAVAVADAAYDAQRGGR